LSAMFALSALSLNVWLGDGGVSHVSDVSGFPPIPRARAFLRTSSLI
jgi:hypothetical protein